MYAYFLFAYLYARAPRVRRKAATTTTTTATPRCKDISLHFTQKQRCVPLLLLALRAFDARRIHCANGRLICLPCERMRSLETVMTRGMYSVLLFGRLFDASSDIYLPVRSTRISNDTVALRTHKMTSCVSSGCFYTTF